MKRPVAIYSIIFIILIFFLLTTDYQSVYNDTTQAGERIRVIGILDNKEFNDKSVVLTLRKAHILSGSDDDTLYSSAHGYGISSHSTDSAFGVIAYIPITEYTELSKDSLYKLSFNKDSFDKDSLNKVSFNKDNFGKDGIRHLPKLGQTAVVSGKKTLFEAPSNRGQFDMPLYYHIRGIDFSLTDAKIERLSLGCDNLRETLFLIKSHIKSIYGRYLNESDSAVLCAMLLGDRSNLSEHTKQLYQNAGISHALSISGLHIGILGYGLYKLLKHFRLPIILPPIICSISVILYSIMVGSPVSTVRAVTMFSAAVLAEPLGRTYDIVSALSLSSIILLMIRPLYIFDSSFLLSFGAVLGIAIVLPQIEDLKSGEKSDFQKHTQNNSQNNSKSPIFSKLLGALELSFSISIVTLPIVLWFFFQFPLLSFLLNLIVIPLMAPLIGASALLAALGNISPIATLLAAFCHFILKIYERGCLLCESFPSLTVVAGRPDIIRIILYYLALISFITFLPRLKSPKLKWSSALLTLTFLSLLMFFRPISGITYTMLDIGQGDCNFLQSADGTCYMIDCGSSSKKNIAKYRVVPYLKSIGVSKIDCFIVTHSDADHINGLEEMLDMDNLCEIGISRIFIPDVSYPDSSLIRLKNEALSYGARLYTLQEGMTFSDSAMSFEVLHPPKGYMSEDANSYSTVLSVRYGNFSALFTGDIQGEAERRLIDEIGHRYTLLKVAHHGSKYSSPIELLEKLRPAYAFISCGVGNSYGHPHIQTLERLDKVHSRVFSTDKSGAITLRCRGENVRVSCYKSYATDRIR